MLTSPIVSATPQAPTTAECDALLERVFASSPFQRSPRLRELLCYLVRHGLEGDHAALKEGAVGQAIYGRAAGYNTNDDNVVRMGVSQLRRKLLKYFEEEGKAEILKIEFPKGSYVPVFSHCPAVSAPADAAPADAPSADGPSADAPPADAAPEAVHRQSQFPRRFAMISALAAIAALPVILVLRGQPRAPAAEARDTFDRFWQDVIGDGRSTIFVSEDIDYLVSSDVSKNGQPTLKDLEAYASENAGNRERAAVQATSQLSLRTCAHLLAVQPARFSHVSIASSREIRVQDFKGKNVILMGSPRACPWIELFDKSLSFHFEFDKNRNQSQFRNRQPRTGEEPLYTASRFDDLGGKVYSLIALLPNLGHTGKVLILTGTRTEGTEAAAEAVATPGTVDRMLESVGAGRFAPLPYFEILLESQLVDGVNLAPRILASRVYPAGVDPGTSTAALR